ncbi:MAG: VWA domain-containing protein [Myxococcota bacterium]
MHRLLLASALGLILGAVASSCSPPLCTTSAACSVGQSCLPSGVCAFGCTSDAQCRLDEVCSAAGGCVARGGCGTNSDCKGAGEVCHPGGGCGVPTPDSPGLDAGPASCGGERFEATRTEANVLIVLDHSGSMMERVGAATKWAAALEAVKAVTAAHDAQIRFGLQMFSFQSQVCHPGQVLVPPGPSTSQAIAAALPSTADGRQTPVAGALTVASQVPELNDPNRANFVLLITDGKENCGGDPTGEVERLFNQGVRTYTVGFGGAVDQNNLNQMAIKGGTARMTTPRYYQADNSADLQQALASIAQGALGCDFRLAQTPPDPTKLYVAIDGQFVPRDPNRVSGWEYTPATNRITLYGPACDALATTPNAKLSIVYGCPDGSITEGGGGGGGRDGGFTFDLDAGEELR